MESKWSFISTTRAKNKKVYQWIICETWQNAWWNLIPSRRESTTLGDKRWISLHNINTFSSRKVTRSKKSIKWGKLFTKFLKVKLLETDSKENWHPDHRSKWINLYLLINFIIKANTTSRYLAITKSLISWGLRGPNNFLCLIT